MTTKRDFARPSDASPEPRVKAGKLPGPFTKGKPAKADRAGT